LDFGFYGELQLNASFAVLCVFARTFLTQRRKDAKYRKANLEVLGRINLKTAIDFGFVIDEAAKFAVGKIPESQKTQSL
jgi:hypothetical protein